MDTGRIEHLGSRIVVRCEHGDLLSTLLHAYETPDVDSCDGLRHENGAYRWLLVGLLIGCPLDNTRCSDA